MKEKKKNINFDIHYFKGFRHIYLGSLVWKGRQRNCVSCNTPNTYAESLCHHHFGDATTGRKKFVIPLRSLPRLFNFQPRKDCLKKHTFFYFLLIFLANILNFLPYISPDPSLLILPPTRGVTSCFGVKYIYIGSKSEHLGIPTRFQIFFVVVVERRFYRGLPLLR